jgi:hypothetical protein
MRRVRIFRMTGDGNVMLTESVKEYYSLTKKNEVREAAKKLRRKFLRYKDAEIVYSMSHKMLLEHASKAGAIYRMEGTVLINRDIFDEYLEQFREPSTLATRSEEGNIGL